MARRIHRVASGVEEMDNYIGHGWRRGARREGTFYLKKGNVGRCGNELTNYMYLKERQNAQVRQPKEGQNVGAAA